MPETNPVIVVCGEANAARFEQSVANQLTRPIEVVYASTKDELFLEIRRHKPLLCLVEHQVPVVSVADQLNAIFSGSGVDMSDLAGNQAFGLGDQAVARELLPELKKLSPDTKFVVTCHIRGGGMGKEERRKYSDARGVERVVGFINSTNHSAFLIKLISKVYFDQKWTPQLLADARNKGRAKSADDQGESEVPVGDASSDKNNDTPVLHVKDGKAYYMKSAIRGADAASFKRLLGPWARDKRKVYWASRACSGADAGSFEPLNIIYGRDKCAVFNQTSVLKGADRYTFEALDAGVDDTGDIWQIYHPTVGYGRDASRVYFAGQSVRDADPGTFVSLGNRFGRDKNHIYFEGRKLKGADLKTWRHWAGNLSLDSQFVYYETNRVAGVHRRSVKLLAYGNAFMDRSRVYLNGQATSTTDFLDRLSFAIKKVSGMRDTLETGQAFERQLDEWPAYY
ncbi:MAG TPA: hypothetical protein DCY13_21220 [Verrucomicrobiales bacterium]|nr:hypothetical protein [Verrucomicrobiales bacterium]